MKVRALLSIGTAALASCGLFGQSAASQPAFEVASVKPSTPEDRVIGLFTYPGGRITATNYTLEMLMEEAYSVQRFQISGGPRWLGDDRYNIVAKPPASYSAKRLCFFIGTAISSGFLHDAGTFLPIRLLSPSDCSDSILVHARQIVRD